MAIYKGFNTVGTTRSRNWSLTDVDLVKRDLLNHFMTRPGERRMRPLFGCKIWQYLMDQNTTINQQIILSEALNVVNAEPRVSLVKMNLLTYAQGIRIEITCNFLETGVVDTMFVDFETENASLYGGIDLLQS